MPTAGQHCEGEGVWRRLANLLLKSLYMEETATQNQPEMCPHSAPPYCVLKETQGARKHCIVVLLNF